MTRFLSRLFLAAVLSTALAGTASAQSGSSNKAASAKKASSTKNAKRAKRSKRTAKASKAKATKPKKAKSFDFEADKIDGDRIGADGSMIFGIRGKKHPSLIRLRGDFLDQILKSAEDV